MNDETAYECGSVSFQEVFAQLKSFAEQNDSLAIPLNHPALPCILDALTTINIEALIEKRWNEQMEYLASFKNHYGHCNTAIRTANPDLDSWMIKQRAYCKLYLEQKPNPLTLERYERLKNVGLLPSPNKWEQRLEELKQYKLQHGHTDVPIDYPHLGIWVLNQRFNLQDMPKERIDKLDAIDFTWNYNTRSSNEEAWNAKYQLLLAYIRQHGHANVPKSNEPLSCWVRKQRYEYSKFIKKRKSQINPDRINKLKAVGFSFRLRPDPIPWEQHFEDLVQFKQEHGHCNISRNHPKLGNWSVYQRVQFKYFLEGKASTIDQAKADKLISIGFLEIESKASRSSLHIPVLPQQMMLPGEEGHDAHASDYNWDTDFPFVG
eukprot:CCRYP_009857-RB/>CCRYP_009857-RB protein AED:0.07 eAED:0.07 QI:324/1/1/1/0.66/0.5/4/151/376